MFELFCAIGVACAPKPVICDVDTYRVRPGDSPVLLIEKSGSKPTARVIDAKGNLVYVREDGSDAKYRGLRVDETVTVESCVV